MLVTLYRNGKEYKTIRCDECDIITGANRDDGALFLIKNTPEKNGIVIDAEIPMTGEFGDDQITLRQPVTAAE